METKGSGGLEPEDSGLGGSTGQVRGAQRARSGRGGTGEGDTGRRSVFGTR